MLTSNPIVSPHSLNGSLKLMATNGKEVCTLLLHSELGMYMFSI